jgi:hypothetical protein
LSCLLTAFLGNWPYPQAEEVWVRADTDLIAEEDFEDLHFGDFVRAGRRVARRSYRNLAATANQLSVLERGLERPRAEELPDLSVDSAIGYTSMVGVMLADEVAILGDMVGFSLLGTIND